MKENTDDREDEILFATAMEGVRPIERANVREKPKRAIKPRDFSEEEDREVLQELENILKGEADLDYTASDEFIEGRSKDCSLLQLARLRQGEFAVQAHVDLHGLNREISRATIERCFTEWMVKGFRCALVICGRGLRSPGGKPVLKTLLARWLAQGQLSRNVLAFASAKSYDGGSGAVYVLLRKNPHRPKE